MKRGYQNKKCGLIGEKLGHSFSTLIHNELADYSFVLREVAKDELENFVKSRDLDAYCVTIPYKKAVMPFLDWISDEAKSIGAVNVVVRDEQDRLLGYNSDYFGFNYMITSSGIDVNGKKALVFGNGGASATVCAVLADKGISETIVVDLPDNNYEFLKNHDDARIIVNTTPLGMYPHNGSSAVDLSLFPACEAVLDVVYNPAYTALVLDAQKRGISAVGGLPMLVAQAAKGFEYFTNDSYEEGCIERITSLISQRTRNIIIVGMPGCGKSTVGRTLANDLGRDFFDADDEFTSMHKITPAEAINTLGEEKFRLMEHQTLVELGKKSGAVISTGGGAVTKDYNYDSLHQNGVIIFLERDLDKLSTDGRPLSQRCSVKTLYEKRIDAYHRFADLEIKSTEVIAETVALIKKALNEYDYPCILKSKGNK